MVDTIHRYDLSRKSAAPMGGGMGVERGSDDASDRDFDHRGCFSLPPSVVDWI